MEEFSILLNGCLGDLCIRGWSSIVHNLAVNMLLGTSFIDRFIRRILPAKRKVVLWHSHPVPILLATQRDQHIQRSISHVSASLGSPSNDDKPAHTQFVLYDNRYANRTANIAL